MLRLLLTCLAFLSGLIAIGAPANAMMAESSVSRSAAEVCDAKKDDARCECRTTVRLRDWRIVFEKVCRPRGPVVFVPTVQLGPDRALE
ncbi:hypothetical protein [Citromicrobium bathyomarinum]|uniref:hypothetical protein n=1 Tax=Citromicrobium bathyomarinum TaxID=72174 RepID=UPI00315B1352